MNDCRFGVSPVTYPNPDGEPKKGFVSFQVRCLSFGVEVQHDTDGDTPPTRKLYKAIIHPHLEYATVVWKPYRKRNFKDTFLIENTQRRATRLVSDIRHLSYEERLRKMGLPTLKYRCCNDMVQVDKILNQIDSVPVLHSIRGITNTWA